MNVFLVVAFVALVVLAVVVGVREDRRQTRLHRELLDRYRSSSSDPGDGAKRLRDRGRW